ncbi:MAG: class I SAM-dependent methyltransferase [Candidatus Ranarchaeia archaeon]|jgi:SAM-dependent methyltransferase
MKKKTPPQFSAFIREYDQAINWETRLSREAKLFRPLFTKHKVKSILDCASASGRHSQLFAKWGIRSVGTDVDPDVIKYARELARSSGSSAIFKEAGLGKLNQVLHDQYDAITILGNGLAFLPSYHQLESALRDVFITLNQGGILITQLVNFDLIFKKKFVPLRYHSSPNQETLFVRYYEKIDKSTSNLNIIVLQRKGKKWNQEFFSFPILNIGDSQLNEALCNSGFTNLHQYGSYNLDPFTKNSSTLLTIAHKE